MRGQVVRTDQGGQGIVATTYYIYDDFGLLRWVLPPKVVENLPGSLTKTHATTRHFCYYYEYDGRRRLIEKRIPGADPVYFVYDNRDRLVMSQDGNQQAKSPKEWTLHNYDSFDRLVYTAIIESDLTVATWRTRFRNNQGHLAYNLATQANRILENLWDTNQVSDWNIATWSYYSNPGFNQPQHYPAQPSQNLKGLLGASRERSLLPNGTLGGWLTTRYFYDEKGRLIQLQQRTDNEGSKITQSLLLDWKGELVESIEDHNFLRIGRITINRFDKVHTVYTYDHAGRLLETTATISTHEGNEQQYSSTLQYDALGRLKQENIDNALVNSKQYNIRNWLTQINASSGQNGQLFNMSLHYTRNSITPQFGGNISSVRWQTMNDPEQRYLFSYDGLNRLTSAAFESPSHSNWQDRYSTSYTYDIQGNIQNLTRRGPINLLANSFNQIDNLSYSYNGNRLTLVYNHSTTPGTYGFDNQNVFPPGFISRDTYIYDKNGNLVTDHRMGRTLRYNILNLPREIEIEPTTIAMGNNFIQYTYSASGKKISQQLVSDGRVGTRRDYAGSFVFVNNVLAWVNTPFGRMVNKEGTAGTFSLVKEFHIRDHLGNTRLVLEETGRDFYSPTHIADYYPFGMEMPRGLSHIAPPHGDLRNNRYLYNGKELQDDFGLDWYDYGARFYDAQIARWHSVDPLAEHPKQIAKSPYAAMWNNPIRYYDPDGRCPECFNDVKDPVEGHIYTSSGNETYVYSNGDWTRQGGDLSEVVVTYEATESQTTATISDLGKGFVEGIVDPVVFTTSSLLAGIGNTALGVNKKIKRVGLIQALDEGGIDVLSNEERFSPIGFSFKNEYLFKREEPNFSGTLPIEDGKRVMKGTVTIVSAGVPTTGLVEAGIKLLVGMGIKTGIGNLPDDKKK